MSSTPSTLRQRKPQEAVKQTQETSNSVQIDVKKLKIPDNGSQIGYWLGFVAITLLGFVTRFWGIGHPDQVVFDEVHFGKFASLYLERLYFFDVHPPLGKLLFAFAGWLVGYDGHFHFDAIGDSYITNKVPYVAFRAMPAIFGALTVSTVYLIMWETGYTLPACLLAAGLVLFDNAHIGQTRLILLDATLVLAMALSVLCYVKFYKLRHVPFSRKWWKWLLLTGIAMSSVISVKYVGVFTFFSIGCAVCIDLWSLLDINRRQGALPLPTFINHFLARGFGLIIVPFFFYLFWFQVHFAILTKSGPGDDFMTPAFQATLSDNPMTLASVGINYFDTLTIKHKETKVYLHSHLEKYPLRYDDGRVSSQGQQVTGYPHNDTNNHWQVLPSAPLEGPQEGRPVMAGDVVMLLHVGTQTILFSHDVASPYYPTNQEFTTLSLADAEQRKGGALFEILIEGANKNHPWKTMSGQFKLIHKPSRVAMWTHTKPLPEWGLGQAEINGNKNIQQTSNTWYIEDVPNVPLDSPRRAHQEKEVKTLPFIKKYLELQGAMFHHNSMLTNSHPYASHPVSWPFLWRGVSFWTQNETKRQIYFLGNPVGWWLVGSLLAVFAGLIGADQLSLRRGIDAFSKETRARLYNTTGFFFLTWAAHYAPFYLMGRQLFLHHYLPSHLASCLVAAGLLEFMLTHDLETPSSAVESKGKKAPTGRKRALSVQERLGGQSLLNLWIAVIVIMSAVIYGWYFFVPLTYGKPGLTVPEVNARKWLGYDLHFAK